MAVGHDYGVRFPNAATGETTSGTRTWTHTASGNAVGVAVFAFTNNTTAPITTTVSYGNVALVLLRSATVTTGGGAEANQRVELWSTTAVIPTGVQTVTAGSVIGTSHGFMSVTVLAGPGETAVIDTSGTTGITTSTNPRQSLTTLRPSMAYAATVSDSNSALTAISGCTDLFNYDWGSQVCQLARQTVIHAAGTFDTGETYATSDQFCAVGIAFALTTYAPRGSGISKAKGSGKVSLKVKRGSGLTVGMGSGSKQCAYIKSGSGIAKTSGSGTPGTGRTRAGSAAALTSGSGAMTVTSSGTVTYVKAGSGCPKTSGTASRNLTALRSGSASALTSGSGARSVTRARAGSGIPKTSGAGSRMVTRTRAGSGLPKTSGAGTRSVIFTRRGSASTLGAGSSTLSRLLGRLGSAAATGAGTAAKLLTSLVKAGSGVSRTSGSGTRQVTRARSGAASALTSGSGARQVTSLVKAGSGSSRTSGSGTRQQALSRGGTAAVTGAGDGRPQVTQAGQVAKSGAAMAATMSSAPHAGRVYAKAGGGCATGAAKGLKQVPATKRGGGLARGCSAGYQQITMARSGGACAVGTGTGSTPPRVFDSLGIMAGAPHGRWGTGEPAGRYAAGIPHGRWQAGEPAGRYASGSPHGRQAVGSPHG